MPSSSDAPQGRQFEVNGARLYLETRGEGAPVVLLHAGICDLRMWDEHVAPLAEKFRVIRYDLRGFGRSSMPAGFYSHIEDLHGLLDALELPRAHLVGVSNGGRVALEFAIRYPLRVNSVVLVAPGLTGFAWSKEMVAYGECGDALAAKGDLDALTDLDMAMWVAGPRRKLEAMDPALVARLRGLVRGANARFDDQAKGTAQWLDPPAAERLAALRARLLVLVGALDTPDMLTIAGLLGRKVAGARTVVLPGVAHLLPNEAPEPFMRLTSEFLGAATGLPIASGHRGD